MSVGNPAVVTVRGNKDYAQGLDRLLKRLQDQGIEVETRHQMAVYALALLASQYGMKLPARSKPLGTNRFGMPKSAYQE